MTLNELVENKRILYSLAWLAFGKYLTIALFTMLSKVQFVKDKSIFKIGLSKKQLKKEWSSLWMILTDAIVMTTLLLTNTIRLADDIAINVFITLVVFFLWVELWMYWTHRWMHEWSFLRKIHSHHHVSVIPHPLSSISFSFIEKFFFYTCGWLLFLAAVSWIIPISFMAIIYFYTFYFIASPIAHMNIEMFKPPKNKIVHSILILGTSTSHALHHTRTKGNYGFLTKMYDKLFHTYFPDTEEIQERAYNKNGLTTLKTTKSYNHELSEF